MYFDDLQKDLKVSASMDIRLVLSINGILIFVVGLMPSYWMELAISLF
jgi:NADH-quinone oxidoreductase subunit N